MVRFETTPRNEIILEALSYFALNHSFIVRTQHITHPLHVFQISVQSNDDLLDDLSNIFMCIPHVKCLHLEFFIMQPFSVLAHLLCKRLCGLGSFDYHITQLIMVNDVVDYNTVRRLHPNFNQIIMKIRYYVYPIDTTKEIL